ncbi:MAG: DUF3343 domain-containing protein [Clostridia bacterium]|nr:DUF3343 domain-containing protein [Clostridia bacterium]
MDCIIAMRSQTYAAKGGRLLQKAGIPYKIVGIDPSLTRHGCAHGLQIPVLRCGEARVVLEKHHLAYGDVLGGG